MDMLRHSVCALLLLSISLLTTGCFPLVVAGAATGASVANDRRTAGTIVDDNTIELRVRSALGREDFFKQSHIVIVSYNNDVLLAGQTPTLANAQRAVAITQQVNGVQNVYNEMEITDPTSLGRRTQDTWLTTKVKTKLLTARDINPTRVKVVSENGTVFLLGIVTPEEATLATDVTRGVDGVQRVVRIFDYRESTSQNVDES